MATEEQTVERLLELLDLKDEELAQRNETIDNLERQVRFGVDWMLHQRIRGEEDTLPTPRVELHVAVNEDYRQENQVTLVLAERDSSRTRVPLSYSKSSGRQFDVESFPTEGELGHEHIRDLPGLVNEACFYSDKTGIPAYVVLSPERRYKVTSLRPLRLVAV